MDERYRLVFRGEILEGQHKAVVKRRLTELLKLDDARLAKLFSGKPIVLKRDVDRNTAARYQTLFKEAGGRLRVQQEAPADADPAAAPDPSPVADSVAEQKTRKRVPLSERLGDAAEPAETSSAKGFAAVAAEIDAPDFEVINSYFPPPDEPRLEIDAPDYEVAEVGVTLREPAEAPLAQVAEVDFELAEVGEDLLLERQPAAVAELREIDFELAEVGADLAPAPLPVAAQAPDISHLALAEL
ncbi:MAG: hypothetical protein AAGE43_04380 [Pseudomonadota bacterium]